MSRNLIKPTGRDSLVLTPRDTLIIRAVYRYRFLSTDQVQVLTGTKSRSKLNDRLRELWGADYLDRPELQRELFAYADKRPTVHALGSAGAEWLTNNHGIRFPKAVEWRAKNKNVKSGEFVQHTLGVTETMLQAERDFGAVPGLRVIDQAEVWQVSPRYNPRQPRPFELLTEIRWRDGAVVSRRTKPDYVFGLGDTRGTQPTRSLYFLEYDRGTESFVKASKTQSSILQKFLGYADVYERKLHTEHFDYKNFRVLFVLEGDARRIENMIAVYQAHIADRLPAGALLFTTTKRLAEQGFLAPIWLDGKRNEVRLGGSKGSGSIKSC